MFLPQCAARSGLQAAPSAAEPAQLLPAGPPLAPASDGDAFAASILVEPGPADASEPSAEPLQSQPGLAQNRQQPAVPGLEPQKAPSDEPMVNHGPLEQATRVDAAAVEPELAPGQPQLLARSPSEQPAGSPDRPAAELSTVEPPRFCASGRSIISWGHSSRPCGCS